VGVPVRAGRESGCGLLLDLNNVYVTRSISGSTRCSTSPACRQPLSRRSTRRHLRKQVGDRVLLIDDHGSAVVPTSAAFERLRRVGPVPTLIEWDTDVPALESWCRGALAEPIPGASP